MIEFIYTHHIVGTMYRKESYSRVKNAARSPSKEDDGCHLTRHTAADDTTRGGFIITRDRSAFILGAISNINVKKERVLLAEWIILSEEAGVVGHHRRAADITWLCVSDGSFSLPSRVSWWMQCAPWLPQRVLYRIYIYISRGSNIQYKEIWAFLDTSHSFLY